MTNWRRRSVLTTGATLATGGVLSSVVAGEEPGGEDVPDPDIDPNPETDAVWPSFDGDAGHARYAADAPEFDGEALEAAWTVERARGEAAVVDGVVYASSTDGIVALDAADGSTIWEYTDVDANRPSVVDDTVYVVDDELYALDAADGDVRWQTEFDPEDSTGTQTVAYGSAFVVVDGTLYALDTDDGSVRWELDSITAESQESDTDEAEFEFGNTTAAANGVVYALAADNDGGARLALDPETGDEIWRAEYTQHEGFGIPRARATTTAVVLGGESYYARDVIDAQTGEDLEAGQGPSRSEGIELVLGEEIYIGGYYGDALTATALSDAADDWGIDVLRNVNNAAAIGGNTVYVHINDNAGTGDTTEADELDHSEYHDELVALDKYDGSERWTISAGNLPIGHVVAIDDETLYVEHDNDLVALREDVNEDDEDDTDGDDEDEAPEEDDDSEEGDGGDEQDNDVDDSDDDDQGELEDDDEDDSEADDGDGESDGDDPADDEERESEDDNDDEQYSGEEGKEDEAESDDGVGDTDEDDDVGDGGDDEASDDGPNGDDGTESEDEPDAGDEDDGVDTDDGDDTDAEAADDDEADSVPGFTTGAGIVGGAVGLEWLRRRAATDASAESTGERAASPDEPGN